MTSPSPIHDKSPKPPGLLPKNVQSWLLVGLAVLMVVIMWLTGGKKPATLPRSDPSAPAVEAPLEVNEAKIVELQSRIQQLQREQNVAQNALAQQSRALTGNVDPQPSSAAGEGPQQHAEDSIREERKKRDYLSLFASNLALSYRKDSEATRAPEPASSVPASPEAAQLAELSRLFQPPAVAQAPAPVPKRVRCGKATERRNTEILSPRRRARRPWRQEKPTYFLKAPSLKLFFSTVSTGSSPVRWSAC